MPLHHLCYCCQEIPVLFVDYGNEGFINEVLMITNNHLNQIPFQGIPAKLHIPGKQFSNTGSSNHVITMIIIVIIFLHRWSYFAMFK